MPVNHTCVWLSHSPFSAQQVRVPAASPRDVQHTLGHADPRTTEQYDHVTLDIERHPISSRYRRDRVARSTLFNAPGAPTRATCRPVTGSAILNA